MRRLTGAALPHPDAFILVFSVLAQWLQARKRLESWLGWIAVNVIAVGVYASRGLLLFAGLYAVFLVLAVVGYRAWRRAEVRS
jgi:nicotinamide mononucleotide transporter